jgi:hypothetical protein
VPVSAVGPHLVTARGDADGASRPEDLEVEGRAEPPLDDEPPVPVDVPAWWLARDNKTVFATGIGRGDRATLMASASLLCTGSVKDAEKIIAAFAPVPKFVDSIAPPRCRGPSMPRARRRARRSTRSAAPAVTPGPTWCHWGR